MNKTAIVNFIQAFSHLKAGENLPSEREIAAFANVARQVIRECILALEMSGCLAVSHGKSTQAKIDGDKWLTAFNKACKC